MKRFLSYLLLSVTLFCRPAALYAATDSDVLPLAAPSAVLVEASTGTVIYEKNAHEKMRPASITKIMTLILIFEALENGSVTKEDIVTVSEHAAGMGGSQVYLETGEEQTVEDLIKCISIASANDACVAMAEYIGGTEEAFVEKMNRKAAELHMNDTHFANSCGLEAEGHLTSAYDIALMSMDLINNHPEIFDYCTVWMDSIQHHTKKGTSEFGLTNTNKLLRYYSYTTGLKTGYTSKSKYCISATACKDDLHLIAVVMAEESSAVRNKEAVALFRYGFANCYLYKDANDDILEELPVSRGTRETVPVAYRSPFQAVLTNGLDATPVEKRLVFTENLQAPVSYGDVVGCAEYYANGRQIGSVDIISCADADALTFGYLFSLLLHTYLLS